MNFPPMRALEFITGHVIYNPAYTYKFQLKTTQVGNRKLFYELRTKVLVSSKLSSDMYVG